VIDLHSHSTASDGTDSPAAVVELAAAAGLSALALTDHDTLDHLPEARAAARAAGLRLVSACEISCELGDRAPGTMHLLVYFVDGGPGPLQDRLGALQESRAYRNERIVAALREQGVDLTIEEVLAEAGAGSVGRPHVAAVLLRKGAVGSIQEAFDHWLERGRPAYFERERLTPEESIELAHASGAVTSVAHPGTLGLEGDALDTFVAGLATIGLDALECDYGRYSLAERERLRALATRHGLAVTGGSDYHGAYKPDLSIGVGRGDLAVADELLDALEARRRRA
jgi:3',5'-nucleoside bisphosphate phosphatase